MDKYHLVTPFGVFYRVLQKIWTSETKLDGEINKISVVFLVKLKHTKKY